MTDSEKARRILEDHMKPLTPEKFQEELQEMLPLEQSKALFCVPSQERTIGVVSGEPISLSSLQQRVSLNAYLASALTGLDEAQRKRLQVISEVVDEVAREFAIEVYQPRHHTDPKNHAEVSADEVFQRDKQQVMASDLVFLITANPSFGAGEEAVFASAGLIPLILISEDHERVSRMLTGMPGLKVHLVYKDEVDLRDSLRDCLTKLRPILENRRTTHRKVDLNIVGERIRFLREEQGLTREMVTEEVPGLTPEALKQIEEHGDRASNPSLVELRQIASALRTTVSDLVEPDFMGRMLAALQEWLMEPQYGRSYGLTDRDRSAIIRRMLIRLLQSFDGK